MQVYLIRHGESISNRDMIIQGHHDSELSDNGKEQAKLLQQYLPNFDRIYSSPLRRAVQTAKISTVTNPEDIILRDNLMEISFGEYEGKNGMNIEGFDIDSFRLYSRFIEDTYNGKYNIEKHEDFHLRVHSEFERIIEESRELELKKIAIFAHGGVLRSLTQFYFKFETQETAYFKNTETLLLTAKGDNWSYERSVNHLQNS